MNKLTVKVARKTSETADISVFELVDPNNAPLPGFSAGSHVDVLIPGGLTRQYSLCNEPHEAHRYVIGVLKDPASRGGSKAMHDVVNEGDSLEISSPKNHFPLAHEAKHSLLFAGGIGVTPILCMAERLSMVGESFEMHYCTRSEDRTAFRERIDHSAFADKVAFHFDNGEASQKLQLEALLSRPRVDDTHIYVCGPKGFMDAVLSTARRLGWPEKQLHFEYFAGEVVKLDSDGEFDVKLASSGRVIRVAKDTTVVAALGAAGVEIPTSCGEGICGSCVTRVLEGIPDHRDMFFMPAEQAKNDAFTPCCSRSKSAVLVLDL